MEFTNLASYMKQACASEYRYQDLDKVGTGDCPRGG